VSHRAAGPEKLHVVTDPALSPGQGAKLVAAFAVIYLVWGSTFLVTRIGVL
jgi:hypothetical protein